MPATLDLRRGQVVGDASRRALNLNTLSKAVANATYAPIASPSFTGDPKAPTPAPGDNDTSVATTAFVHAAVAAGGGITQLTGDGTAGPGSGSQPLTLAAVNSNVGTFQGLTVSAKGLVTAAANQNYATTASLGTIASQNANAVTLTGGTINGISVGATTPNTGAFTTLSASSTVSGAGFITLLAPYAPLASPTFTGTVNTAALTASGAITPSQTAGIVGTTTSNNANAGSVGEYVASDVVTPGVNLPTGAITTVTSISLTAGDWDVEGVVVINPAATTTIGSQPQCWVNNSAVAAPGSEYCGRPALPSTWPAGALFNMVAPRRRFSLASTTTIFLSAYAAVATSTCTVYGQINARRVR